LNHLEITKRRTKQVAASGTFQCLVQCTASEAKGGCTDRRSKNIERCHCDLEAIAAATDQS
jgi:hypothetical protein